jgi:hypothetical protein
VLRKRSDKAAQEAALAEAKNKGKSKGKGKGRMARKKSSELFKYNTLILRNRIYIYVLASRVSIVAKALWAVSLSFPRKT